MGLNEGPCSVGRGAIKKGEWTMSQTERIQALRERHEALETKIDVESNRPHPNDMTVAELKKQKLRIRDEIEELAP